MECLFVENLNKNDHTIDLPESERRHAKSLRLDNGSKVLITNGIGLSAEAIIRRTGKESYKADCLSFFDNYNEFGAFLAAALPVLDSRDRFEYSIEKAVELGVKEILPFYSEFSSPSKLSIERTNSKILAALKQCKRSLLPVCKEPVFFNEIDFSKYDTILIGDESGTNLNGIDNKENFILTLCGPEGGLSSTESRFLGHLAQVKKIRIGASRLRSETASISLISLVVNFLV